MRHNNTLLLFIFITSIYFSSLFFGIVNATEPNYSILNINSNLLIEYPNDLSIKEFTKFNKPDIIRGFYFYDKSFTEDRQPYNTLHLSILIVDNEKNISVESWVKQNLDPLIIREVKEVIIKDNGSYGAYSTGSLVDAEDNWWGHSSGPYHPTDNPSGQGDEVSDNINFIPWLTSSPQ